MPPLFVPATFSAIQVSPVHKHVQMELPRRATRHSDAMLMWRWFAYALFSRHARLSQTTVTIPVDLLDEQAFRAMETILQAENPLAKLYNITPHTTLWISATRFCIYESHGDDRRQALLTTREPLRVRVIDTMTSGEQESWRVLLPGRGVACVKAADASLVVSDDDRELELGEDGAPRSKKPLHLMLEGMVTDTNKARIGSILGLVHPDVHTIELGALDRDDPELIVADITDFVQVVLGKFRALERLSLPRNVAIARLGIFTDVAAAYGCRLRSLALAQLDTTDVIAFLETLADTNHPLTQRLEEIKLAVFVPDHAPFGGFRAAWDNLLEQNRTFHTISLELMTWQKVARYYAQAIRTGPLCLRSKIAFLRCVDTHSTCGGFDASILSIVFRFAAPHRIRTVRIRYD